MKIERTAENGPGSKARFETKNVVTPIETESWQKPHPHFRVKRILAPVDFSEPSKKALQYSVAAARDFGAELIVMHVVQPYPILPDVPAATVQLTRLLEKEAKEKLARLVDTITGVSCRGVVRLGSPARLIASEAKECGADLIVISTHGRTGLPHLLMGSVAEHVVRLAECPVLTIHVHGHDVVEIPADDCDLNKVGEMTKPARPARERKSQPARSS
jgi:universal stress protein A